MVTVKTVIGVTVIGEPTNTQNNLFTSGWQSQGNHVRLLLDPSPLPIATSEGVAQEQCPRCPLSPRTVAAFPVQWMLWRKKREKRREGKGREGKKREEWKKRERRNPKLECTHVQHCTTHTQLQYTMNSIAQHH